MGLFNFFFRSNDLHSLKKIEPRGFRSLSKHTASYCYNPEYQRQRYLIALRDNPYITYDQALLDQLRRYYGTQFTKIAIPVLQDENGYYIRNFQYSRRYRTLKGLLNAWHTC